MNPGNPPSVQPTRVLLMATSMRGGGSEHQVVLLARHLPRELFEVHLYLSEPSGALLSELPSDVTVHAPAGAWAGEQVREQSRAEVIGQRPWQRLSDRLPGTLLRRQANAFASVVHENRIDVIYDRAFHNTLIAGHPAIRGRLAARRISTIVSLPHLALPMLEKRFVAVKRRFLAAAYRDSDAVIAVSDAAAESAAKYYGLRRQSILVIPNPVDVQAVRAAAAGSRPTLLGSVRADTPIPPDTLAPCDQVTPRRWQLVCVGRMTQEKGQADLIAAIGLLAEKLPENAPRLTLRFVGDGPDRNRLQQQWTEMAGAAGSVDGHRVEFAGVVTPAAGEISRADALVLPSRFEGMPNVVLEAFAVGTPVVATRSGGTVQLQASVSEPTCFWAEPGSAESLCEALIALLSEPAKRAQYVLAGKRLVEREHSVAAAIRKITAILLPQSRQPL